MLLAAVSWREVDADDEIPELLQVYDRVYHAMLSAAPPDNTVQELREQLNEADRRAGAAERQMQSYVSECQSRKDWIRKAKEQWGVDNSVSFDLVWKEALQLRDQVAELVEASNRVLDLIENGTWCYEYDGSGDSGGYLGNSVLPESDEVLNLQTLVAKHKEKK